MTPRVSVILPTFNRAEFLPAALASIRAQTCTDWELVVVDDGSTDATRAIVEQHRLQVHQSTAYVWQKNGGPASARNAGLDRAHAPFIAFFDSDDLWLPHHLERCLEAFTKQPVVDWVFAACRIIDGRGAVIQTTTFEEAGRPRPFLTLRALVDGDLHVVTDRRALEWQFRHGLYCGLQNSVIRSRVFDQRRFWEDYRVGEDTQLLVRALAGGACVAYLTDVHVLYRIHQNNSSGSAVGASRDTLRRIYEEKVRGLEHLESEMHLTRRQAAAFRHRLAHEYFWHLGYVACWQNNDRAAALTAMRKGLQVRPFDLSMWKTYLLCHARAAATDFRAAGNRSETRP